MCSWPTNCLRFKCRIRCHRAYMSGVHFCRCTLIVDLRTLCVEPFRCRLINSVAIGGYWHGITSLKTLANSIQFANLKRFDSLRVLCGVVPPKRWRLHQETMRSMIHSSAQYSLPYSLNCCGQTHTHTTHSRINFNSQTIHAVEH